MTAAQEEFFELKNAEDPRLKSGLEHYLMLERRDMGLQRVGFRAWATWRRLGWVMLINTVVALAFFVCWPGSLFDRVTIAWITYTPFALPYLIMVLLSGVSYKQRVCQNGLVLGFRGRTVIPWETIDPGRVHHIDNFSSASWHPDLSLPVTHHAGIADRGLVVCGKYPGNPPFAYWLIGTRSPEKLAAEIESAMCDFGLPAEGLAENAVRTKVRAKKRLGKAGQPLLPPLRGLFDPVIGVPKVQ
ncbi:hypothetical protein [Kineosporia babensis]|uniref:Uncharacterized protein n=1 Tax=Kineosporia babensis TaxID=499548 RepID=A0A9X1NAH2_9ACTN|nr:hypothetical protein [Kineosporia babensis]MCD5311597.1 hypothetical protein [Kineosporia babensis]